jgi:hemoglobin
MRVITKDISSRDDIVSLLNEFYGYAQSDEIIGVKFNHINMAEHTQLIADFWDGILFGTKRYQGDPFGKHLDLNLTAKDFERWILLFNQTIDKNYSGPIADEAKYRAGTIAQVFQHKLGLS